jgi:hypothetical protein
MDISARFAVAIAALSDATAAGASPRALAIAA